MTFPNTQAVVSLQDSQSGLGALSLFNRRSLDCPLANATSTVVPRSDGVFPPCVMHATDSRAGTYCLSTPAPARRPSQEIPEASALRQGDAASLPDSSRAGFALVRPFS